MRGDDPCSLTVVLSTVGEPRMRGDDPGLVNTDQLRRE